MAAAPRDSFKNTAHASSYKKYRRMLPQQCVDKIVGFLSEKFDPLECCVVDVGCGSGQSTIPLAPYFKSVLGLDTSEAQLKIASTETTFDNVKYKCGGAEAIPVPDESVHLVNAVYAVHWFDLPAFYKEVDRVLVPGGVLSVIGQEVGSYTAEFTEEQREIYMEMLNITKPYWSEQALQANVIHESLELPYKCFIRDHSIKTLSEVTVQYFFERFKTNSGVARFIEKEPERAKEVFDTYMNKFMKTLGTSKPPEEALIPYRTDYVLLMARKP